MQNTSTHVFDRMILLMQKFCISCVAYIIIRLLYYNTYSHLPLGQFHPNLYIAKLRQMKGHSLSI